MPLEHRARSAGSLVPLKAASHRSQALCLFVKRVNFFVEPRHLRFWRFGAPVVMLAERARYGLFPAVDGGVIPTGPNFVTKDNAEKVRELSARSIR